MKPKQAVIPIRKMEKLLLWKSQDGRKVTVDEMATGHIQNCLRKCMRDDWRQRWVPIFRKELARRGVPI